MRGWGCVNLPRQPWRPKCRRSYLNRRARHPEIRWRRRSPLPLHKNNDAPIIVISNDDFTRRSYIRRIFSRHATCRCFTTWYWASCCFWSSPKTVFQSIDRHRIKNAINLTRYVNMFEDGGLKRRRNLKIKLPMLMNWNLRRVFCSLSCKLVMFGVTVRMTLAIRDCI